MKKQNQNNICFFVHKAYYLISSMQNAPTKLNQIMKAIVTKYLSATNSRGSRIKASAEGVKSITIGYPHDLSGEDCHKAAAVELCKKYGWSVNLVGGGLPNCEGYAFCFANQ